MLVSFLDGLVPWKRCACVRRRSGHSDWTANQAEWKVDIALEDIMNRHGTDNRVPGSSNEGAHLTGLVITGGGVSACEV